MNVVQYTAKLDLTDNGCFDTGWRIKQGDYGNSIIVISIVNNGEPVFDSAVEPTIAFKRADGRTVVSKMIAGVNNYIYTFAGNELEISGPVVMDVKFEDSDARISTASCKFTCVEDTIGYDPTGADTYNNPVSEIAKEAFEQLVSSEAWAIGKRNGIDVGPEDKTYHNNAKYWSEKSGSSRLISMYDVDINSPQDKQVLVYDATSQKWINGQGSGGGGTSDYNDLTNRPRINGEELVGNKSADDLGLALKQDLNNKTMSGTKAEFDAIKDDSSIPIGSSFDITDDYEDKGEIYTTSEARCGTWIDGKPLYRIALSFLAPQTTDYNFATIQPCTIANMKQTVRIDGIVNGMPINVQTLPLSTGNGGLGTMAWINVNSGVVSFRNNRADFSNTPVVMTIEYTKTTD